MMGGSCLIQLFELIDQEWIRTGNGANEDFVISSRASILCHKKNTPLSVSILHKITLSSFVAQGALNQDEAARMS